MHVFFRDVSRRCQGTDIVHRQDFVLDYRQDVGLERVPGPLLEQFEMLCTGLFFKFHEQVIFPCRNRSDNPLGFFFVVGILKELWDMLFHFFYRVPEGGGKYFSFS